MLHELAIIISTWIIPFERIHYLIIIILAVAVLLSDKSPNAMLAWIFTIFTFPVGGAILYLLFGINWRRNKIISKKMKGEERKLYSKIFNFMQRDVSDIFRSKDFFYFYLKGKCSIRTEKIYKKVGCFPNFETRLKY